MAERDAELVCVVEVGHAPNTPADWFDADHPRIAVCDHHKGQFESAYGDDYSEIEWRAV